MSAFKCRVNIQADNERMERGYRNGKRVWKPVSEQIRFVIRMASACAETETPYAVVWNLTGHAPHVALSATKAGPLPTPKRLKREPVNKPAAWKPAPIDASYSLNGFADLKTGNPRAGYVLDAGNGLAIVKPGTSESGEIELSNGDKLTSDWFLIHTPSGQSFGGYSFPFQTAVKALNLAASMGVDWTVAREAMEYRPEYRAAYESVLLTYGRAETRENIQDRQRKAARQAEAEAEPIAA